MKKMLLLFSVLICLIYSVNGYIIQTKMQVGDKGEMNLSSNNNGFHEKIDGNGTQTYERLLKSDENSGTLYSDYIYKPNLVYMYYKNLHEIGVKSSLGMEYSVKTSTDNYTESHAEFETSGTSINAIFECNSENGTLNETVIESRNADPRYASIPKTVSTISLKGKYEFTSQLSEKVINELDVNALEDKLDYVETLSGINVKSGKKEPILMSGSEPAPGQKSIILYNEAKQLQLDGKKQPLGKERNQTFENALDRITEALKNDQNSIDSWVLKGNILRALDRYEEAIYAFEYANKIKVDRDVTIDIGISYYDMKDYEKAIEVLEKAAVEGGSNDLVLSYLARSYLGIGNAENALITANKAVSAYPGNPKFYYYKGLAFKAKGEKQNALDAFNESIDRDLEGYDKKSYDDVLGIISSLSSLNK